MSKLITVKQLEAMDNEMLQYVATHDMYPRVPAKYELTFFDYVLTPETQLQAMKIFVARPVGYNVEENLILDDEPEEQLTADQIRGDMSSQALFLKLEMMRFPPNQFQKIVGNYLPITERSAAKCSFFYDMFPEERNRVFSSQDFEICRRYCDQARVKFLDMKIEELHSMAWGLLPEVYEHMYSLDDYVQLEVLKEINKRMIRRPDRYELEFFQSLPSHPFVDDTIARWMVMKNNKRLSREFECQEQQKAISRPILPAIRQDLCNQVWFVRRGPSLEAVWGDIRLCQKAMTLEQYTAYLEFVLATPDQMHTFEVSERDNAIIRVTTAYAETVKIVEHKNQALFVVSYPLHAFSEFCIEVTKHELGSTIKTTGKQHCWKNIPRTLRCADEDNIMKNPRSDPHRVCVDVVAYRSRKERINESNLRNGDSLREKQRQIRDQREVALYLERRVVRDSVGMYSNPVTDITLNKVLEAVLSLTVVTIPDVVAVFQTILMALYGVVAQQNLDYVNQTKGFGKTNFADQLALSLDFLYDTPRHEYYGTHQVYFFILSRNCFLPLEGVAGTGSALFLAVHHSDTGLECRLDLQAPYRYDLGQRVGQVERIIGNQQNHVATCHFPHCVDETEWTIFRVPPNTLSKNMGIIWITVYGDDVLCCARFSTTKRAPFRKQPFVTTDIAVVGPSGLQWLVKMDSPAGKRRKVN